MYPIVDQKGAIEYGKEIFGEQIQLLWPPRFAASILSCFPNPEMQLPIDKYVENNDQNNLQDVPDVPDVDKSNICPRRKPRVHVVDERAEDKQGGHGAHEPVAEIVHVNVDGQVGDEPKEKLLEIEIDNLLLIEVIEGDDKTEIHREISSVCE